MHYNSTAVSLCATKATVWIIFPCGLLLFVKGGKHLGVADTYAKIPYDLSGSISKNRFRQELCWGISKMFDLFDKEDFCVVFDYKCDIEIHFNDSIELYQIKTHKIQSPYKFSDLKRHKEEASIIAKLFVLKDASAPETPIRCAIVSNAFLQIGRVTISDKECFSFDQLDKTSQAAVRTALSEELSRENIDLTNLYYIYTPMNLLAPQNDIIGKITGSFEKIKGCEPVKPNALYRLIVDTVTEKACYELSSQDYSELIHRKGITKAELDNILNRHMEKSDNSVALIQDYIEQRQISIGEKRKLKISLAKIVEDESKSLELQKKQQILFKYMDTISTNVSFEEMAEALLSHYSTTFPIEYSQMDIYVFILLVIKRWECGLNE